MSSSAGARNGRCASSQAPATAYTARRLGNSDWAESEAFIQAAHAVALQIDRDVCVADGLQPGEQPVADVRLDGARQLVDADLEARELIVVPHAADAESEVVQHRLGLLDHAQLLVGDFRVIRNPGGQACGRGLVPGRQTGLVRQLANLRLGQADFVERAAYAEFASRLPARTIVATIVGVAPVGDRIELALAGQSAEQ